MPANTKAAHLDNAIQGIVERRSKLPAEVQFISRVHAAAILDADEQLIDKLIKQGKLPAFKIGRKVIVRKDDLLRLVEGGRVL
jgi:excisionase family DNA binding protein